MSIYKVCAWEVNGYDDSDFKEVHYDNVSNSYEVVEVGSTRYAGPSPESLQRWALVLPLSLASNEDINNLRLLMVAHMHKVLIHAEEADCLPQDAPKGYRVRLLRSVKHKGVTYEQGLTGSVFWCGAFGKFYANGCNRPNRSNLRVGITFDDGRKAFVALKRCEREAPALSSDALLERAKVISWTPNVGACFGCRAWLSADYLTPMLQKLAASIKPVAV